MILVVHVKFIPQNNYSSVNITQYYGNYPRFHASFQRASLEKINFYKKVFSMSMQIG